MKKIFSVILILFVATLAFAQGRSDYDYNGYGCNGYGCNDYSNGRNKYNERHYSERYGYKCFDDSMFLHTYQTYFWFSKEDAEATQKDIETHIKNGFYVSRVYPTGNGCIVIYQRSNSKW